MCNSFCSAISHAWEILTEWSDPYHSTRYVFLVVIWFGALRGLLFASLQSSHKAYVAPIFTHQVFKKQFNILFTHCFIFLFFACFSLGMLFVLEPVVYICSHAGKSDTLNYAFRYLVFFSCEESPKKNLLFSGRGGYK